jgi:methyltransferase-like protein/trans-aconitate methyltransferase
MTDTVASYNQVPYAFYCFPESHPRRLQAVAHLFGLDAPAPAQCRVLELGCAVGGNIVPMAYSLPNAQLIGIDLVASQIETAKQFASGSGVTNLDLRAANIADVTAEWGKFDYIVAHGVFSYVPPDVTETMLQICAAQLSASGVAYISFNTYPGWHARMWAREAMQFRADEFDDPIQQARAGRDFILALAQAPFTSTLLQGEAQYLQGRDESYIVHEYLERTNQPFYFRDFAARIAERGLQYLGDAFQNGMVAAENWAPFRSWMEANRDNLIRQEQYVDFVRNREFRRALICRSDLTIDRTQMLARAETMQAASYLRQSAEPNGMTRFAHSRGGDLVTGAGPLHDALVSISRRFPQTISVKEVIDAAGQQRAAVLRELLNCWMNGMLELYVDPPPVLTHAPSDKPRASLVARYLAAQNQAPINQRHGSIPVDATQRRFIQLLDGTRTREQLASELGMASENIAQLLQFAMNAALLDK